MMRYSQESQDYLDMRGGGLRGLIGIFRFKIKSRLTRTNL